MLLYLLACRTQSIASDADRAKCLSKWLSEAMAVREGIRVCFPKNPAKKVFLKYFSKWVVTSSLLFEHFE